MSGFMDTGLVCTGCANKSKIHALFRRKSARLAAFPGPSLFIGAAQGPLADHRVILRAFPSQVLAAATDNKSGVDTGTGIHEQNYHGAGGCAGAGRLRLGRPHQPGSRGSPAGGQGDGAQLAGGPHDGSADGAQVPHHPERAHRRRLLRRSRHPEGHQLDGSADRGELHLRAEPAR